MHISSRASIFKQTNTDQSINGNLFGEEPLSTKFRRTNWGKSWWPLSITISMAALMGHNGFSLFNSGDSLLRTEEITTQSTGWLFSETCLWIFNGPLCFTRLICTIQTDLHPTSSSIVREAFPVGKWVLAWLPACFEQEKSRRCTHEWDDLYTFHFQKRCKNAHANLTQMNRNAIVKSGSLLKGGVQPGPTMMGAHKTRLFCVVHAGAHPYNLEWIVMATPESRDSSEHNCDDSII